MIKQEHFQTKEKSVDSKYKKLQSLPYRVEKMKIVFKSKQFW